MFLIKNNTKKILKFLQLLTALGLLSFLCYSIGFLKIINTFKQANLGIGIIVGCCIIVYIIIGAFNSWIILNTLHTVSFPLFFKIYFYGLAASFITPGQAGDALLVLLLRKHGISLRQSSLSYAIDKAITLSIFFIIGWYGTYILIPDLRFIWRPIVITLFIVFLIIFFFLKMLPKYLYTSNKIYIFIKNAVDDLKKMKIKWYILLINISITLLKWIVVSFCYFFAFLCFDSYAKWPEIAVIPVISTLVGYIPVSIGGIGTVELTATQLFSRVGIESSAVLSAYLLIRSIQYFLAFFLLIFFLWKKNNSKINLDN